jgi:hypothetical protein
MLAWKNRNGAPWAIERSEPIGSPVLGRGVGLGYARARFHLAGGRWRPCALARAVKRTVRWSRSLLGIKARTCGPGEIFLAGGGVNAGASATWARWLSVCAFAREKCSIHAVFILAREDDHCRPASADFSGRDCRLWTACGDWLIDAFGHWLIRQSHE